MNARPFTSTRTWTRRAGAIALLAIAAAAPALFAAAPPASASASASRASAARAGDANGRGRAAHLDDATTRVPVLMELFTSEGCSSCPPADDLLARLVGEQPVRGADIIALGFHVDYWDKLGWRDRFSNARYTIRQNEYARSRRSDDVFTPQAIVDGRRLFVGSNWDAARQALTEAVSTPKLAIVVADASAASNGSAGAGVDAGRPSIRVEIQPSAAVTADGGKPVRGDVMLAVTEDGLVTEVQRGENAKRRLTHAAVVRSLDKIGRFDNAEAFSVTRSVPLDHTWRRDGLKVVVFVQEPGTMRVLGVAARPLQTELPPR